MHRKLIINADDFGLTPGVSEGITHGGESGIITSTSVMMNQMMHQKITAPLHSSSPLGRGVHLNITTGFPVLPPEDLSTLVQPDGSFLNSDKIFDQIDRLNLIQVEKEWRAQIIGFLIKFGQPDHLNSHHHIHLHPRLFPIFAQIAGEMRIPIRFPIQMDPLDVSSFSDEFYGLSDRITPKELQANIQVLERACLRFPDYFCDDFITPHLDEPEELQKYIRHLPEGITEMMCHPGFLDDQLFQVSTYTESRAEELKALTTPHLRGIFEKAKIELVNFSHV